MSFPHVTGIVEDDKPDGIRTGLFAITSELATIPDFITADKFGIEGGRVYFLRVIPGKREFVVGTYRSDDIEAIREVDQ